MIGYSPDELVFGIIIEQRAEIMQLRAELAHYQPQHAEPANDGDPTLDAAPDTAPPARKAK